MERAMSWLTDDKVLVPAITAVVVGLLNHFQQQRSAQKERRAARITAQLENLYGPVCFYADHIAFLWQQMKDLGVVDNEGVNLPPAIDLDDEARGASLAAIRDRYLARLFESCKQMMAIIEAKYHFCEPQDFDLMQQQVLTAIRSELEEGLPADIGMALPSTISQAAFRERIHQRMRDLLTATAELSGST
jgi:hypothetical protein